MAKVVTGAAAGGTRGIYKLPARDFACHSFLKLAGRYQMLWSGRGQRRLGLEFEVDTANQQVAEMMPNG